MPKVIEVISEADLQGAVTDLCTWLGLWWWHDADSRKNKRGLPDLLIVGDHGAIWRELKTDKGRLRADQMDVCQRLQAAGHDAGVWRPADWRSGRIRAELKAIRANDPLITHQQETS